MLRFEGNRDVRTCDGVSRRDFLRAGSLAMGLSLTGLAAVERARGAARSGEPACIQLFLLGGPSHIDTWDPKPDAPENIRGPFRPIRTNVPGILLSEHFPRLARMMDRVALVRSLHHDEAPVHETGQQLLQTGRLSRSGVEYPHVGAVIGKLRGGHGGLPPWVVLPRTIGNTGLSVSHGQSAGFLGTKHEPLEFTLADRYTAHGLDPARLACEDALVTAVDAAECAFEKEPRHESQEVATRLFNSRAKAAFDLSAESSDSRERYGHNTFGQSCLLARRLVEHGVRLVTVNMFDTVFNRITWDCHANGSDLDSTLDDYRDLLCPMLDRAYAALLRDLQERGLLQNTLVLCMGEFGRTPRINNRGGRDHWPGVWSALLAGGGVQGGRVIGASDGHGMEPADRPVQPAEIVATAYRCLGVDPQVRLPGPDVRAAPLVDAAPVSELF